MEHLVLIWGFTAVDVYISYLNRTGGINRCPIPKTKRLILLALNASLLGSARWYFMEWRAAARKRALGLISVRISSWNYCNPVTIPILNPLAED